MSREQLKHINLEELEAKVRNHIHDLRLCVLVTAALREFFETHNASGNAWNHYAVKKLRAHLVSRLHIEDRFEVGKAVTRLGGSGINQTLVLHGANHHAGCLPFKGDGTHSYYVSVCTDVDGKVDINHALAGREKDEAFAASLEFRLAELPDLVERFNEALGCLKAVAAVACAPHADVPTLRRFDVVYPLTESFSWYLLNR